MIFLSSETQN